MAFYRLNECRDWLKSSFDSQPTYFLSYESLDMYAVYVYFCLRNITYKAFNSTGEP